MQKSIVIEDGTGSEVLENLNNAFETLATNFTGSSEPEEIYPSMIWIDTSGTNPVKKQRSADGTSWITLGTFTNGTFVNADSSNQANKDLSNLSSTGNSKFSQRADLNLSNLSTTGVDKIKKDTDRLYEGENLETKFQTEIATYGNVYAWLKARKDAGNFSGIHIGDYINVAMSAGTVGGYSLAAQTFKCRVIGINTYKNCGDSAIGNMLYFSSDQVINTPIKWNPTDNNNGTASQANPWLASAMYAILNGVNNYTTSAYGSAAHGASCAGAGVLQLLPSALQNVMVSKRNLLDSRYSASGLLTGGTGWNWGDMGKLWLPNEYEVYGCAVRSNLCQTSGYWHPEAGLSIQFPYFANNCQRRIKTNSNGSRCYWWLSAAASYNSGNVCGVSSYGYAGYSAAADATIYVPLCFCI